MIGFQHFIALWKADNKSNQIEQILKRNFAQIFAQMEFALLQLYSFNYSFKNFEKMLLQIVIRWVKGFSKMYNLLQFSASFLHIFAYKIDLDFCKFAIFSQIFEVEPHGLS